jgi:heat shock protein HslJ
VLGDDDWRLVSLGSEAAHPTDAARRPWLRFQTDSGRVVGSGGCNRLSGPFTIDGSSLRFGAIISTKMACADQALNRQEQALFTALASTDRYEIARRIAAERDPQVPDALVGGGAAAGNRAIRSSGYGIRSW